MSDTPRTDAQYKEYARRDNEVKCVSIDFARELERELNKEHVELIRWMVQASGWCEKHKAESNQLRAENERLKQRILDWDSWIFQLTGTEGEDDSFEALKQFIADKDDQLTAARADAVKVCKWFHGSIVEHNAKKSCECGFTFQASLELIDSTLAANDALVKGQT